MTDLRAAAGLDRLEGRRVLVVEDDPWHHARMLAWLDREGIAAVGLTEVSVLEGDAITGSDGSHDRVRIELADVGSAFLDFYFPGPYDGSDLTRALANAGIRCFGMSSVPEKNRMMIEAGAFGAVRKSQLGAVIAP